jgi:hypothetical protein
MHQLFKADHPSPHARTVVVLVLVFYGKNLANVVQGMHSRHTSLHFSLMGGKGWASTRNLLRGHAALLFRGKLLFA